MINVNEWILESKENRQFHLDLNEECLIRGGTSDECRGVLAQYLNTNIPKGMKIHLCHACHNGKCSNPKHLYWGTAGENIQDSGLVELGQTARQLNISLNRERRKKDSLGEFEQFKLLLSLPKSQTGTEWITNGIENKKIRRGEQYPIGFYKGMIPTQKQLDALKLSPKRQ